MSGIVNTPNVSIALNDFEVHSESSILQFTFNQSNRTEVSNTIYGQGALLGMLFPYDSYDSTTHVISLKLINEKGTITIKPFTYSGNHQYDMDIALNSERIQYDHEGALVWAVGSRVGIGWTNYGVDSPYFTQYDCDAYGTTYTLGEYSYNLGVTGNKPIFKFDSWFRIECIVDDTIDKYSHFSIPVLLYYRPAK